MKKFTAKRLPQHQGVAAWNAILGAQASPSPFEGNTTADIVIIGGGFAGLSSARRLKQLGPEARIILLEAGRIAEGAAGRNSGFMIDLPHELTSDDYAGGANDAAAIGLNRQAIEFAQNAVSEYGIDQSYFDPAGKVNGAVSETAHGHNQSYAKHLEQLGEPSQMLDQKQMQDLTGSSYYRSGLYTSGTVMLQPAGYVRGMASGLINDGISVHENSPVLNFSKEGQDWRIEMPRGTISTSRIILANNGHLESFGFERGRLMQVFLFASMTPLLDQEALDKLGGNPRWGITPSDPMGTTMRKIDIAQGGDRIITRTCAMLLPGMVPTAGHVARASRVQQVKFEKRFPQFSGMKMEFKWAGHLCLSLNNVSVMDEIETGVFSACVQNGLGTTRGTLTGIGAAELALGESSNITDHFAAERRPQKLPPRPFREIGANAVLKWKEWRARNE